MKERAGLVIIIETAHNIATLCLDTRCVLWAPVLHAVSPGAALMSQSFSFCYHRYWRPHCYESKFVLVFSTNYILSLECFQYQHFDIRKL